MGAGSAGQTASVAPRPSPGPISAVWYLPVLWAVQHCPLPRPPKRPSKPPWQCPNLRNPTQYKPLLGGILLSPFNRLEVFYILRKTTFELVVLFSELCFVFALIKFPLTQISIKCGSHQRQTLATPCLLFSERRTCLCYGNVSPEWADSGSPHQPQHTLSAPAPAFLHRFKPHNLTAETCLGWEFCFYRNTHHQIFQLSPGWWFCEAVKDASLESENWGPPPCLTTYRWESQISHLTSLSLTFSICTMEVINMFTFKGRWQLNEVTSIKHMERFLTPNRYLKFS